MSSAVILRGVYEVHPKFGGPYDRVDTVPVGDIGPPGIVSRLPSPRSDGGHSGPVSTELHVVHCPASEAEAPSIALLKPHLFPNLRVEFYLVVIADELGNLSFAKSKN